MIKFIKEYTAYAYAWWKINKKSKYRKTLINWDKETMLALPSDPYYKQMQQPFISPIMAYRSLKQQEFWKEAAREFKKIQKYGSQSRQHTEYYSKYRKYN